MSQQWFMQAYLQAALANWRTTVTGLLGALPHLSIAIQWHDWRQVMIAAAWAVLGALCPDPRLSTATRATDLLAVGMTGGSPAKGNDMSVISAFFANNQALIELEAAQLLASIDESKLSEVEQIAFNVVGQALVTKATTTQNWRQILQTAAAGAVTSAVTPPAPVAPPVA
jgi:hypothetical protein